MRLLLKKTVDKLGKIGDVVNVRDGYGRNYLLPKGLATSVTPENIREIAIERAHYEEEEAKRRAELAAEAETLVGASVTITMKAGEEGHLYGAVTAQLVSDGLAKLGYGVDAKLIKMEPIKEVGEFTVVAQLHAEVTVDIKVWVVAEGGEALTAVEDAKAAHAAELAAAAESGEAS